VRLLLWILTSRLVIAYEDQAWGDREILHNCRCAPGARMIRRDLSIVDPPRIPTRTEQLHLLICQLLVNNGLVHEYLEGETDRHPSPRLHPQHDQADQFFLRINPEPGPFYSIPIVLTFRTHHLALDSICNHTESETPGCLVITSDVVL